MAQVLMPNKKPSSFDEAMQTVMQGLTIANQVYGIKEKVDAQEKNKLDAEKAKIEADKLKNVIKTEEKMKLGEALTPEERSILSKKYQFRTSKVGSPGVAEYEIDDGTGTGKKIWAVNSEEYKNLVDERVKKWDRAQGLRKEFDDQTKKNREAMMAHEKLKASASHSGALSDMAIIFAFLKILDPGSTIKENEFDSVRKAKGLSEQVKSWAESFFSGRQLTDSQKAQILTLSGELARAHQIDFMKSQQQFLMLAEDMDLNYYDIDRTEFSDMVNSEMAEALREQQKNQPPVPAGSKGKPQSTTVDKVIEGTKDIYNSIIGNPGVPATKTPTPTPKAGGSDPTKAIPLVPGSIKKLKEERLRNK